MKYVVLFFLLLSVFGGFANDGSFYASGNTLMPLKESTIQLKKEVLNLTRREGNMQVDIYFEFFNPGEEKELLVGFVTPPATGDIGDELQEHPQITDFMVMVDNGLLPYKIARLEKSGFKINEKLANGNDFVYHFTVRFKKGITMIRHSYQYTGGASVSNSHEFYYRLTTGATWANKEIEDFELNVQMGDDVVFNAPYRFDSKKAAWNIVGIGKVNACVKPDFSGEGDGPGSAVYIRRGFLQLKEKHFSPTSDLFLLIPLLYLESKYWCAPDTPSDFVDIDNLFDKDTAVVKIPRFSDAQLRLYRNLHFARMGYDFKDPLLKKTFSRYIWYIPDPNLKLEGCKEKYFDKQIQSLLEAEEKKRGTRKG